MGEPRSVTLPRAQDAPLRRNHVDLSVPTWGKTRAFFETYIGLRFAEAPVLQKTVVALDENDMLIALSTFGVAAAYDYP